MLPVRILEYFHKALIMSSVIHADKQKGSKYKCRGNREVSRQGRKMFITKVKEDGGAKGQTYLLPSSLVLGAEVSLLRDLGRELSSIDLYKM